MALSGRIEILDETEWNLGETEWILGGTQWKHEQLALRNDFAVKLSHFQFHSFVKIIKIQSIKHSGCFTFHFVPY